MTIETLLQQLTNVKPSGAGYTAKCPAHDDNRNSLSIAGDNESGKIILHCHAGCEPVKVCDALGINIKDLFSDTNTKPVIIKTYDYIEPDGTLRYQVCRYKPKDFRQRRPDPEHPKQWIYNLKGIQPIIYNLPAIIKASLEKKVVIIVEGEKDAETLINLGFIATCNSGGAGKFPASCVNYFLGCGVVIIPDNDEPGKKHADKVANMLLKVAREIRIIELPANFKDVTDYINAGYTVSNLTNIIKSTPKWQPKPQEQAPLAKPPVDYNINPPFRFLGCNSGIYYYLPKEDLQITPLSAEAHSPSNLISLAPLSWWEAKFPTRGGADWNTAKDFMFRNSKKRGIFDSRNLRGCGTWFDNNRVVQHNGDHLIVDGIKTPIDEFETRFIYNASFPIDVSNCQPLTKEESQPLLNICRMPSWEKPISGTFLAGWTVIAPVCGALLWRPHIWLTGASGTGKSWISDNMVKPLIGQLALHVQSNTTEAGIRQILGINAFPVIFDEAEGEDMFSRKRLQSVLELMRQASTETGAPIIKGGQSGHATEFRIRSCFLLSSIGVNINQKADASRVTILSLSRAHPGDRIDMFDELKEQVINLITPEFAGRLRSRTLNLIPVILKNTLIFSRAVAERFSDQRIGDQFGALLAGAWSLISDNLVSPEKASKFISEQDWTDQSAIDEQPDEIRCLNKILEHVINYNSNNTRIERSIGDILYRGNLSADTSEALERVGIRVSGYEFDTNDNKSIIISDSHKGIRKILQNEPWEVNWARILKRIPGSISKQGFRFNGAIHRATEIPYIKIFKDE